MYVVYHYSRAKRASAEGGKYSVISGIQRISNFLRLFYHSIHGSVDTELIFIENVKYRLTFHIKFVSSKILIIDQFMD